MIIEILVSIILLQSILLYAILRYKAFKEKLEGIIIKIEKEFKTEEGFLKLCKVIDFVRKTTIVSHLLSKSKIIRLIEQIVAKLNQFSKVNNQNDI